MWVRWDRYTFLLKGHEDLRQDERVMQLFGLVNELLNQFQTSSGSDVEPGTSGADGTLSQVPTNVLRRLFLLPLLDHYLRFLSYLFYFSSLRYVCQNRN